MCGESLCSPALGAPEDYDIFVLTVIFSTATSMGSGGCSPAIPVCERYPCSPFLFGHFESHLLEVFRTTSDVEDLVCPKEYHGKEQQHSGQE